VIGTYLEIGIWLLEFNLMEYAMANELIINVTSQETRVALLEDRVLAELYIERTKDLGIMGNIYKGKVVKVLPGMQAAFVDIGLDKAAFLYVTDVYGGMEDYEEMGFLGMEMPTYFNPSSQIEDLISEGQEILVQVSKEPLGTKGTRITSHITLPGRYLVFMAMVDHVGVSRKIKDEKERRRLREIVQSIKPPNVGFRFEMIWSFLSISGITFKKRRRTQQPPASSTAI
jgi:ribonuclease G